MTTRHILAHATRLLAGMACALATVSCGSELLRTGRAPVFLQIDSLQGGAGETRGNPVLADVATEGSAINEVGEAIISVVAKDQTGNTTTSPLNTVTVTRYRVEYFRADGRNTPGVDVPFAIDGGVARSLQVGSPDTVVFDLVRHGAKLEPPLRNLRNLGGNLIINTIARVTFFGRDQNGNEVSVSGQLDVVFADFPDP
jgi:hypothetical protein